MYVWELVSCRLRVEGWHIWHSSREDAYGSTYTVHMQRPGMACDVCAPTLTEAYAAAARRARDLIAPRPAGGPHFHRVAAGVGI